MKFDFDPGPKFNPKMCFLFFFIFGRNDLKIKLNHVWTMRGPSFANVKDKRGTKERRFDKISRINKIYSFEHNLKFNFEPGPKFKLKMRF